MELASGSSTGPGKLQQPLPVPFNAFDDHSSSSSDSDDDGTGLSPGNTELRSTAGNGVSLTAGHVFSLLAAGRQEGAGADAALHLSHLQPLELLLAMMFPGSGSCYGMMGWQPLGIQPQLPSPSPPFLHM